MITRDEYLVRYIESIQDEIEILDPDEVYDCLEHILDILTGMKIEGDI